RRPPLPIGVLRPGQVRRLGRELDQRPAAAPHRRPQRLRRRHRAVRAAAVLEPQEAAPGPPGMSATRRPVPDGAHRPALDSVPPSPVLLPTTVIGSYSVPEWLGQLKNDCYRHQISRRYLDEIHEMAIKAAVVDQERAGLDIISDGELRRDNDVDYLLARIPGVDIPRREKADYFDYYDARADRALPGPGPSSLGPSGLGSSGLGLAE